MSVNILKKRIHPRIALLFLIVLLLLVYQPVYGQISKQIKFNHLSLENGLSDNIVTCFLRDSHGFLWIGTQNGLNRYDGYSFTVYQDDPNDPKSLTGNWISDMVEDAQGNIWIATSNGTLNRYDYKSDWFEPYAVTDSNYFYLMVKDLFIDKNNNLWVAILREGLYKYNSSTGLFKAYKANGTRGSISSNLVSSIARDSKGFIWVLTNNGLLNKLDTVSDVFTTIRYTERFIGNPLSIHTDKLYIDSDDRIWIGTQKSGLYIYDQNDNSFLHYTHDPNKNSLSNNSITCVLEDKDHLFWITTDHGGMDLFNIEKEHFTHYTHKANDNTTLSNDQVYTIYRDPENIYWVGNYLGGVNYFTTRSKYFQHYYRTGDNLGLSNSSVLSLIERTNGEIWIGTDGGGINILFPESSGRYRIANNPPVNKKISSDVIASLLEDSKGRIWIGTYLSGLNMYDPASGRVKLFFPYQESGSSVSSPSVWCLLEDSKQRIWVGTLGQGLYLFNEKAESFYRFPMEKADGSGTAGSTIYYLYEDSKHNIWLAPSGSGLDRFNDEDSTFTNFRPVTDDPTSLSSEGVLYIYEDSGENLWIGTLDGLNRFDPEKETFVHITMDDGLPNNRIQGILEDRTGNLWLSTASGLCKYDPVQKTTRNYFNADGLLSHQFAYKACLKTKTGELFFGGVKGITSFYPDSIKVINEFPEVVITDLKLFNKKVKIGNDSPLKENILVTKEITLRYNQNFISLNYAALEYLRQDKVNYAYFMEGLEDSWNYVGQLRTASYTGLKPGKYTFYVKALSSSGTESKNSTNLKININPPFWGTVWFRILFVFIVITSLYAFYLMRVHTLKKQKLLLEKRVYEKTAQLSRNNILLKEQTRILNETNSLLEERTNLIEEQTEELRSQKDELIQRAEDLAVANEKLQELNSTKDRFFSIIAHDLKNPFNTIIGFSEMLLIKLDSLTKEKLVTFIKAIYNSSRSLYNLLENLLLWSRSQSERIKFQPSELQIKGIVEANILLQRENIKKKEIKIQTRIPKDLLVFADTDMMDTIIRNLLSNAIKFTPNKGIIEIACEYKKGNSIIRISDTGRGIPADVIPDLFRIDKSVSTEDIEGEKGTGLGLILCKEFIDKHNGRIFVESIPGKGSTFTVSLPGKV